ncbi:hypothetical protein KC19_VG003300 [Ceratodon purpureus]|uniref:TF-B3 domain-containing protein n=1 Tax=Ceratodon purpureus TaxID=3225 RepID=A0A8T0HKJ8_CERPU|nr:hypothetical protein KC19_VG003300 [Ceratodon purpureus]KAG0571341.1 hypothetical protein KC19_VG003300 [Ceratodon purpureus]
MQTPLEIPAGFTKRTGWPKETDCYLVTSISSMKQWPLKFLIRNTTTISAGTGCSNTFGTGWSEFLRDQGIEVGERSLVVAVYPPDSCMKFTKTLRATHIRSNKSARLDIQTRFWREFGEKQFDGISFTLRGPSSEAVVKSCCHRSPTQIFCFFASGWSEYCRLNLLKKDDTLLFSAIDTTVFHVTKLEKATKS